MEKSKKNLIHVEGSGAHPGDFDPADRHVPEKPGKPRYFGSVERCMEAARILEESGTMPEGSLFDGMEP